MKNEFLEIYSHKIRLNVTIQTYHIKACFDSLICKDRLYFEYELLICLQYKWGNW